LTDLLNALSWQELQQLHKEVEKKVSADGPVAKHVTFPFNNDVNPIDLVYNVIEAAGGKMNMCDLLFYMGQWRCSDLGWILEMYEEAGALEIQGDVVISVPIKATHGESSQAGGR